MGRRWRDDGMRRADWDRPKQAFSGGTVRWGGGLAVTSVIERLGHDNVNALIEAEKTGNAAELPVQSESICRAAIFWLIIAGQPERLAVVVPTAEAYDKMQIIEFSRLGSPAIEGWE